MRFWYALALVLVPFVSGETCVPPEVTQYTTVLVYWDEPFSFTVPVSGTQPITLTAGGLPAGLSLNGNSVTGIVPSGSFSGATGVEFTASNACGTTTKNVAFYSRGYASTRIALCSLTNNGPVQAGETATLSWTITHGQGLTTTGASIAPTVPGTIAKTSGSTQTGPLEKDTKFTLTTTNAAGSYPCETYVSVTPQAGWDVQFLRKIYGADQIPWCHVTGGCGEGWPSMYSTIQHLNSGHLVVFGNVNVNPLGADGLYLFRDDGTFLAKKSYRKETGIPWNSGHYGNDGGDPHIISLNDIESGLFLIIRNSADDNGLHLYRASNTKPYLELVDFLGSPHPGSPKHPDGTDSGYYGTSSWSAYVAGYLFKSNGDNQLSVYRVSPAGFELVDLFTSDMLPVLGIKDYLVMRKQSRPVVSEVYQVSADGTATQVDTWPFVVGKYYPDGMNPSRVGINRPANKTRPQQLWIYEVNETDIYLAEERMIPISWVGALAGDYFVTGSDTRFKAFKGEQELKVEYVLPALSGVPTSSLMQVTALGITPQGQVIAGYQLPGPLLTYQISAVEGGFVPPQSSSQGVTSPSFATPSWAAPAQNLITLTGTSQGMQVSTEAGYTYNVGYYTSNNEWKQYNFGGQSWLASNARTTIPWSQLPEEGYILAYLCDWAGTAWDCAPNDSSDSKWAIQSFRIGEGESQLSEQDQENADQAESESCDLCILGAKQCSHAFGVGGVSAGKSVRTCQVVDGCNTWVDTQNCDDLGAHYWCFSNRVQEGCVLDQ